MLCSCIKAERKSSCVRDCRQDAARASLYFSLGVAQMHHGLLTLFRIGCDYPGKSQTSRICHIYCICRHYLLRSTRPCSQSYTDCGRHHARHNQHQHHEQFGDSVSFPRTLRHVDRRRQDLNRWPMDHWTTCSTCWTTAIFHWPSPACTADFCLACCCCLCFCLQALYV